VDTHREGHEIHSLQPAAALAAFEQSQKTDPHRFRNVFGAAQAAALTGDRNKARKYYGDLLDQVGANATGRAEIAQARAFVAKR
jgi:hypothetical protein